MIDDIVEYAQENDVPIIEDEGLDFILDKIDEYDVKNILEVGSAIGYSAIMMAKHNQDIKITTLEIDIKRYYKALENILDNNFKPQIEVINTDANDFKSEKEYDLIFLDGPKSQYANMLDNLYANLKVGGIVIVDNLGFHGLVYQEKPKIKRRTRQLVDKIKLFRESIVNDKRFEVILYDNVGDGMGLFIKREGVKNE